MDEITSKIDVRHLHSSGPTVLREAVETAGNDIALLSRLVTILGGRNDDESLSLCMKAAARLNAARKAAGAPGGDILTRFLSRRGLVRASGEPLHRYQTDQQEFEALRDHLISARKLGKLDRPDQRHGAAFVMFGAEWFRRSFAGGATSWHCLTDVIGPLSQQARVELTQSGLTWWRRRVRRLNDANEWLYTLRLEGGFPSRLLESSEKGWLVSHLRRLIAAAASDHSDAAGDETLEAARHDPYVPQTFRTPDFHALCAELARAIVTLRRQHGPQADAAGLRLSAWLDACEPTWRSSLAIGGEGASRLLDDLVSESIQTLAGTDARCRRQLLKVGDRWVEALYLGVDGGIRHPRLPKGGVSRLHAFPAGHLADIVAGAVCVLEPSDDGGPWLARPRVGPPRRPIPDYPFKSGVTLDLRTEGSTVTTMTWPGGDPVRADVVSFVPDDGHEESRSLSMVATGSCRNKRPILFVSAPDRFDAATTAGSVVEPMWAGDGRRLFRIAETTHVTSENGNIVYRIEPNADRDEAEKLTIQGTEVRGACTREDEPVFAGAPAIVTKGNSVITRSLEGVSWRRAGDREWRDLRRESLPVGTVEIIWRDQASRVARDRVRVAILPEGSDLRREALADGSARFTLEGASGWSIRSVLTDNARIAERQDTDSASACRIRWEGPERRTLALRLAGPAGATLDVVTPFPYGAGRFLQPDGTSFPNNVAITLDRLKGARAVADGKGLIWIETHGPGQRASHRVSFYDELPLWSLRDTVSVLLAEAGDLDSEAWIGFHPVGTRLRVRRYEADLKLTGDGGALRIPALPARSGQSCALKWRSLVDMGPDGSRTIAPIAPDDLGRGGTISLPADLPGPGVAYLADGDGPVSRPLLVSRPHPDVDRLSPLRRAVLIGRRHDREEAFRAALSAIGAGAAEAGPDLDWLTAHLSIPDRLSPWTFEALVNLSRDTRALAALVASAPDDAARDRAWGLERELPFLWVLVPVEHWRDAFAARQAGVRAQLEAAGMGDRAEGLSREVVENAAGRFAAFDDTLVIPFCLAGLIQPPSKTPRHGKLVAQDYIRRLSGEDEPGTASSCFHTDAILPHIRSLGGWLSDFDESHHEALEAPIVAALRAGGRPIALDPRQQLRIRQAMIQDQQHFGEAYAPALMAIAAGR